MLCGGLSVIGVYGRLDVTSDENMPLNINSIKYKE